MLCICLVVRSTPFPYTTLFRSRVLLVDDNEVNREVLTEMLRRLGHDVTSAADGEQGQARLESATFDAVFMEDRKSTRLNSSHLVISYAVFCLKNKTRTKYLNKQ